MEDRRDNAADLKRGDDRPAGREPALVSVRLTDVQRVELDAVCAKELLGRTARGSGGLPEESGALSHGATLTPLRELVAVELVPVDRPPVAASRGTRNGERKRLVDGRAAAERLPLGTVVGEECHLEHVASCHVLAAAGHDLEPRPLRAIPGVAAPLLPVLAACVHVVREHGVRPRPRPWSHLASPSAGSRTL